MDSAARAFDVEAAVRLICTATCMQCKCATDPGKCPFEITRRQLRAAYDAGLTAGKGGG